MLSRKRKKGKITNLYHNLTWEQVKSLSSNRRIEYVAIRAQRYVRLKAADDNGYCNCIDGCGGREFWSNMQGGHFFPRTKKATILLEENIHPQMPGCNKRMGHGDTSITLDYRRAMIEMYGIEFLNELEVLSKTVKKFTNDELFEELKKFEEGCNYHAERLKKNLGQRYYSEKL